MRYLFISEKTSRNYPNNAPDLLRGVDHGRDVLLAHVHVRLGLPEDDLVVRDVELREALYYVVYKNYY